MGKVVIGFGALVSALLGYDLGVLSGAIPHLKTYLGLQNEEVGIIVGSFSMVQAVGTPIAGHLANVVGRKPLLAGSCVIATMGTVLMMVANSFVIFLVGRIVTGLGVGSGLAVAPTYLAELSSQRNRGAVVSQMEVYANVGILLGFVAGAVFGFLPNPLSFRMMFAMGLIPCVAILLALSFMPESPRWLLANGHQSQAHQTLQLVLQDDVEVSETYAKILQEINQSEDVGLLDLFTARTVLPLRSCVGLAFCFAGSGIDCVLYYTSTIFKAAGEPDEHRAAMYAVVMAVCKTLAIMIAVIFFDSLGRKPLVIASFAGMTVSLLLTAFLGIRSQSPEVVLTGLILYVCSFSLGLGPGFYLLCTEVWPLRIRAVGTALAATIRGVATGLLTLSFLSLAHWFSYEVVLLSFAGCATAGAFFTWWFILETQGKTLEMVTEAIAAEAAISGDEGYRSIEGECVIKGM
eukprot:gnl/MRDRNA2_/MRDRNA2_32323_c0_seq1.p1 gnl/MRDRNA2_/MRDRNA2_32323_c0~~gnl/MRDRNA2_/MRDRNA2_32323_c0_seq1.p1  ORF type:complete len:462 (-),score=51.06 gnl/MRDRNA2_/MRDRNA2_32323_c0_seq1:93-1478(-)